MILFWSLPHLFELDEDTKWELYFTNEAICLFLCMAQVFYGKLRTRTGEIRSLVALTFITINGIGAVSGLNISGNFTFEVVWGVSLTVFATVEAVEFFMEYKPINWLKNAFTNT
jgi:hypothetical protein